MTQRASDIFSEFERTRDRMHTAWQQVIGPPGAPRFCAPVIEPPVDVYETEGEVVVLIEIAGIANEEVEVLVDGRTLIVRGERRPPGGRPQGPDSQMEICQGPFQRELLLPSEGNPGQVPAGHNAGP